MIEVRVLDIQPHPAQATHNPGGWAIKFEVAYDGTSRTFWRWHDVRELVGGSTPDVGRYVTPSNKKPTADEIIKRFWDNTFAELHGFSFNKADP